MKSSRKFESLRNFLSIIWKCLLAKKKNKKCQASVEIQEYISEEVYLFLKYTSSLLIQLLFVFLDRDFMFQEEEY